MTPAEELAAADRLDALIAVATPAPWTQQHGPLPILGTGEGT